MEINVESLKNDELKNNIGNILDDEEIRLKLEKALKKSEEGMKFTLNNDEIVIEEIKNDSMKDNKKENEYNINLNISSNELAKNIESTNVKEDSFAKKALKSFLKVSSNFLDNTLKVFLKQKFKVNYSIYNDAKNAITAIFKKDIPTFFKKSSDAILNSIKKIPVSTKKILKDTKNVAIDEFASWKNNGK